MLAVVSLGKAAEIARKVFGDEALAVEATALMDSVDAAIQQYGIFGGNATLDPIYAFEVDGFGHQVLMDDANLPNLLSIPYLGYHDKAGLYDNTRDFSLRPPRRYLVPIPAPINSTNANADTDASAGVKSKSSENTNSSGFWHWHPGNPYYYEGAAASGLGSNHMSHGLRPMNPGSQCEGECIWPLGLIMEGVTAAQYTSKSKSKSQSKGNSSSGKSGKASSSRSDISGSESMHRHDRKRRTPKQILDILLHTDANQSYMHEGFNKDDPTKYNRDLFGWANSMFAAWISTMDI